MRERLIESFKKRLHSYNELVASITNLQLAEKLEVPKHKSLIEHLWCVVGARESYTKALLSGEWQGFTCSMSQYTHDEVCEKLLSSEKNLLHVIDDITDWTPERERLLLELSDHEVMHEGGIIRHMYAFELEIPQSVKWA